MGARKWTLAGLATAAILGGASGQIQAQVAPKPTAAAPAATGKAAVVNGEDISMAELEAVMKRAPQEVMARPESERVAVRRIALETIIDDVLRHQFLREKGPVVAKADIDAKLADLADMLKKKDGKTLEDFYKDTGETPESLRTGIGYQLQWIAYLNAVGTDEALLKYYTANKEFFDGAMVEASHIVLRLPEGTVGSKAELAKRDQLSQLRKAIVEGKMTFEQAAKQYSEDESGARGGAIGCFGRRFSTEEEFAKAAFALPVGQISDVVQTGMGLHLIKVTDRKPGTPSDFKAIKEKVRLYFGGDLDQQILAEKRQTAKIDIAPSLK